jgi:NAD(P)-dependent dehydrogenase (short-subunit alcohol dehydrogenase family)
MTTYDLTGRSALVTGASQGLGLRVAQRLAEAGADLFLCARNLEQLTQAAKEVTKACRSPEQKVLYQKADISKSPEVTKLAEEVLASFPELKILVSNAGVYGPMGRLEDVDLIEFWQAVEINLLGPVLLARSLLPHFRKQSYGKIIQISGGGATNPLPRIESYAASKAAVVRLMESLALDLLEYHVDVNSVSPGILNTRLLDQVLEAGPEAVGLKYYERMKTAREKDQCVDPTVAANLCLFLSSAASDGITGRLISAVWDDYDDWPNHLDELNKSDVYTLKRITGRNRQHNWGDK